jgi:predicted RNA binding protein YcfA (HicA-like mRNA interferase family)
MKKRKRKMPPLPIISGDACVAALKAFGYQVSHQKGSHIRLTCPGRAPVTVPRHKSLDRGTLRSILRTADITVDQLLTAL